MQAANGQVEYDPIEAANGQVEYDPIEVHPIAHLELLARYLRRRREARGGEG